MKRRTDFSSGFAVDFGQFMRHLFSKSNNFPICEDDNQQFIWLKRCFINSSIDTEEFCSNVATRAHYPVLSSSSRLKFPLLNIASHLLQSFSFKHSSPQVERIFRVSLTAEILFYKLIKYHVA